MANSSEGTKNEKKITLFFFQEPRIVDCRYRVCWYTLIFLCNTI